MDEVTQSLKIPILRTVDQFVRDYPAFSKGKVREDLFFRRTNGLAQTGAIICHGRKIMIDCERYFEFIREQSLKLEEKRGQP